MMSRKKLRNVLRMLRRLRDLFFFLEFASGAQAVQKGQVGLYEAGKGREIPGVILVDGEG